MKRTAGVLLLVLALAGSGYALEFSLKLKVGAAYISAGDYNDGVAGANGYYAARYANVSSTFSKLGLGMDFGAELMVDITQRLGLGLGFGYMHVSTGTDRIEYGWSFLSWTFRNQETQAVRTSAMPLTLNIHYRIPLQGLNLRVFAGAGFYLGRMEFERTFQSDFLEIGETVTFEANKNAFGFQGGLGVEIPLSGRLFLTADIAGRYARLSDIEGYGEFTPTIFGLEQPPRTGGDYFFWYYEQTLDGTRYERTGVGQSEPAGPSPRHGRLDLSGVSVQVGIKFNL